MYKILCHCPRLPRFFEVAVSHKNLIRNELEIDWLYTICDPYDGPRDYRNIAYKLNKAREIVLNGDYDYLFNTEWDIILPPNALVDLVKTEKKVVSGLYRLRPSTNLTSHYAIRLYDPEGPQDSDDRPAELHKDFEYGDVISCVQVCLGCLLIHRTALEKHEFLSGIDVTFSRAMLEAGIPLYCHTGVKCVHLDVGAKPIIP